MNDRFNGKIFILQNLLNDKYNLLDSHITKNRRVFSAYISAESFKKLNHQNNSKAADFAKNIKDDNNLILIKITMK